VRPAVVPTYFRSSGSMPLIGFRLRLLRTLATIQHNSTITDSCKHFLDDNLLFDHIITILQNFSSEFLKLSGSSRCYPCLSCQKHFASDSSPNLNSTTKPIQHITTTTPYFGLILHCKPLQSMIKVLWQVFQVVSA
jgi:hypothetical protein